MSPIRPRRVAVLADTDSRWKWGMLTAGQLESSEAVLPYLLERGERPSDRQLALAGVDPERLVGITMAELPGRLAAARPDVLVVALGGGGVLAAVHALAGGWPAGARRPVLVSGYFGVVYEKLVEGLLGRIGSDVVLANSPDDVARFRAVYAGLGLDPSPIVEAGLPFLATPEWDTEAVRVSRTPPAKQRRYTVTFAAQPSVPGSRTDRRYLVERLIQHARLHPERRVLLKLRTVLGERATHIEPYPYPRLLRRAGELPPNLEVSAEAMPAALAATDLLVTVSSTAALEAMHAGVAAVLLTDFGVRESLGNAHFLGSGCLASFDEVDDGLIPTLDGDWARRHGVRGYDPAAFQRRIDQLLASAPAPLRPYYTRRNSPAYLPRLLASYGLDADGRSLAGTVDGRRRVLRQLVRSTARSLYRTGTDAVAPALRKLGAL